MSSKCVVHQYHHSAVHGDAITNQMIFLQRALLDAGIGGDIFAHEIKGNARTQVLPFDAGVHESDMLLLHHSHGNPRLSEVLRLKPPKALVYHNITPEIFLQHDPDQASLARLGRRQLGILRDHTIASFADSEYNALELAGLKYEPSPVLPLYDLTQFLKASLNREESVTRDSRPLLFVGRIAPHKNQALIIKVFFYLKRFITPALQLVLVGGGDPIYRDYLQLLVKALDLGESVLMPGKVSDLALDRYYQTASAFLCVSGHEGYCIPLVEAMARGIPVFALPTTGVKGTLGQAGVHLRTEKPWEIAETIATISSNKTALDAVLRSQRERIQALKKIQSAERAVSLITTLLKRVADTRIKLGEKNNAHL